MFSAQITNLGTSEGMDRHGGAINLVGRLPFQPDRIAGVEHAYFKEPAGYIGIWDAGLRQ
jgi:hypothetical protein